MIYLWIIYCLILSLGFLGVSLATARSLPDFLVPLLLLPLLPTLFHDLRRYLRHRQKSRTRLAQNFQSSLRPPSPFVAPTNASAESGEVITDPTVSDSNRRLFLRLAGSSGIAIFLLAVFGKKSAQAAFFGSVPGPGTVAVKNIAGATIDPAEKQSTDGYEISEVDDASTPAYYGFVHQTGAWYITKEDSSGGYRYAKGASDFATSWTGRAALSYDYFDNVF